MRNKSKTLTQTKETATSGIKTAWQERRGTTGFDRAEEREHDRPRNGHSNHTGQLCPHLSSGVLCDTVMTLSPYVPMPSSKAGTSNILCGCRKCETMNCKKDSRTSVRAQQEANFKTSCGSVFRRFDLNHQSRQPEPWECVSAHSKLAFRCASQADMAASQFHSLPSNGEDKVLWAVECFE